MIGLVNVTKTYAANKAVQSIDLTFPEGKTGVLIGPSGGGKSTLLRLIIGLTDADSGFVMFNGTRVSRYNIPSLRIKMGYVIQEGGLFPHLTAYENVSLMAHYLMWDQQRISRRLQELTYLTRFPHDGLDRFPAQLSGGQRQRVSLMRALMLDPDVLLLDEPLGALDPLTRAELQKDLKLIFQGLKKTVVLVTHDMGEAAYLGDLIILLHQGRIVQQGCLDELLTAPAHPFVTHFINAQRRSLITANPSGNQQ